MSASILDGRKLAGSIEESLRAEVATFAGVVGRAPRLVVVLVGEMAASASYVKSKADAAARVGIDAPSRPFARRVWLQPAVTLLGSKRPSRLASSTRSRRS